MSRIGAVLLILLLVFAVPIMDAVIGRQPTKEYKVFTLGKDIPLYMTSGGFNGYVAAYNGSEQVTKEVELTYDESVNGLVLSIPTLPLEGTPYIFEINIFVNDTDANAPYYRIFAKAVKMTISITATDEERFDLVAVYYDTDENVGATDIVGVIDPEDDNTFVFTNGTAYEYTLSDALRLKALSTYQLSNFKFMILRINDARNEVKGTLNPGDIVILTIKFYVSENVDITAIKERYYVALTLVYVVALAIVYRAQLGRIFRKTKFELPFGGRW